MPTNAGARGAPRRKILIAMMDGMAPEYMQASDMPNLKRMVAGGFYKTVSACMPTVTNVNNASICTAVPPAEHGITANSYFDLETRREEYMDRAELLLAPTVFERAGRHGLASALLTAKRKTQRLLCSGAEVRLAAESPDEAEGGDIDWVDALGPPPDIYSAEINHWLLRAVHRLLVARDDIDLVYYHTTDYPMHMCDHTGELSQRHLAEIDGLLGAILNDVPDLEVYMTADHGMSYKRLCHDLNKAMPAKGLPIFFAMSAERDPYVKHHRTFGGAAYVWLNAATDYDRAVDIIRRLEGVEAVYSRYEAASRFRLHPERIGDLMVVGDKHTVFGPLDGASEALPETFRTHGSLHEMTVPLIVYNRRVDYAEWDDYVANYHVTKAIGF